MLIFTNQLSVFHKSKTKTPQITLYIVYEIPLSIICISKLVTSVSFYDLNSSICILRTAVRELKAHLKFNTLRQLNRILIRFFYLLPKSNIIQLMHSFAVNIKIR